MRFAELANGDGEDGNELSALADQPPQLTDHCFRLGLL
jgi:hypothetical protein